MNIYKQYLCFIDETIDKNKSDEKLCKDLKSYCNNIIDEDDKKTV